MNKKKELKILNTSNSLVLKACSYGVIATAILLLQWLGCMDFNVSVYKGNYYNDTKSAAVHKLQ